MRRCRPVPGRSRRTAARYPQARAHARRGRARCRPPPTSPGAASNWGFTNVRNAPSTDRSSSTAGRIVRMLVNETSHTARSNEPAYTRAGTSTIFVRSSSVTRSSLRSDQSNCARPTSTDTTCAAPRLSRQSVNPPVEHPTSTHVSPAGSTPNASRAPASLRPPRPTYGMRPLTCKSMPGLTIMPGELSRSPPDETRPAINVRRASARFSQMPWKINSSSRRTRATKRPFARPRRPVGRQLPSRMPRPKRRLPPQRRRPQRQRTRMRRSAQALPRRPQMRRRPTWTQRRRSWLRRPRLPARRAYPPHAATARTNRPYRPRASPAR